MFERVTAALGFVLVAAGAVAVGLLQRPTPAPPQPSAGLPGPGWRRVAVRTWNEFNRDQIPQVAGGVAFFALLSMVPAIAAFVSLYGLFADVDQVPRHLAFLAGVMPRAALSLASDEMTRLAGGKHPALGFAFAISLIAALWSANGAVKALFTGLNTAYQTRETRGLIQLNLVSLAFTLAGLFFTVTAFGLLVSGPPLLRALGWNARLDPWIVALVRWPLLFVGAAFSMAMLYQFGPCNHRVRWRWATVGSALASLAWLTMSMGLSWYVSNFGHYERTYGSLGAVIAFMTWLWLSAIVILAGAELNSEIEAEAAAQDARGGEAGAPPRPSTSSG
jgi:membrane protein